MMDAAAPGAIVLLLAAVAIDAVLPERRPIFDLLPHPVRLAGALIATLERRWNDVSRSDGHRRAMGVLCTIVVAGIAAAVGFTVHRIASAVPFGWIIELVAIVSLVAWTSLAAHVRRVADPLARADVAGARLAVAAIVGRDVSALDHAGIARAAIESLAENFSDAVAAPVFWYLVLGLPGLCAFKAVSTLDSMIGHRSARYRQFGWASARLDDAANLVPARMSTLVIAAAAACDGGAGAALRTAWQDAPKHHSPNAGWPEAAMAGALGLALGGPRNYGAEQVDGAWLGAGRRDAGANDIARALVLARRALFVLGLWLIALAATT